MRKALFAVVLVALLAASACRQAADGPSKVTQRGEIKTGLGVTAQTIKLGELAALTGSIAVIGKPLQRGHEVYFQYVNDVLGGVGKDLPKDKRYKVELVTKDAQYVTDVHVQQYNAIKGEVLAIAQSLGTPTTKAILPQINEDKILTGAATLSSDWLREKYLVPAGAPYPVQYVNASEFIVREQKRKPKAGIIYQEDDYGAEGLKGLEYSAKEFGFEIVARATYKPTDQEFTAQVTHMKNAGADHVFLSAIPGATSKILGSASTLEYSPRWVGQSPIWIVPFAKSPIAPYMQQNLWVVNDAGCEWGDTATGCEGMKEMLGNIQKYAADQVPDLYFAFGYTQARIFHQILEKAVELGDLTRAGVVKAFESLRKVDMGGLLNPISYGSRCKEKVPVTASAIYEVDPAKPVGLKLVKKVDSDAVDDFPFCA